MTRFRLLPLFLQPQSIVPKTTPGKMEGQEAAAEKWKPNLEILPSSSVYPRSQAAGANSPTTPDTGCCWCFTDTSGDCRAGSTCRSCDGTRRS